MPVTEKRGDLLSAEERVIIHGCNCLGVMGSGVAKLIRDKWPVVFDEYSAQHSGAGLALGSIQLVRVSDDLTVVNCMTQYYYGTDTRKVNYEAMTMVAEALDREFAGERVAMPMIGCGLAGGKWPVVKAILEEHAPSVDFILYLVN